MEVNIKKLKPHPLNIKLYGEEEVDEGLVASIKEKGILVPIVIKEDKTIISGHRRWVAAKKAGLKTIPARVATFKTKLSEKEAILDFNRNREKTFSQKMAEAELSEEIEGERAKGRSLAGKKIEDPRLNLAGGVKETLRVNLPGVSKGRAREIISKKVGIGSGVQYRKSKKIVEAAERDDDGTY